jgi:ubiquinone/menaquinone biosynthesis C-methylase UbiE
MEKINSKMHPPENDRLFSDKIPKIYDIYAVPLYFQEYANDLAERLNSFAPNKILEIAAGTGVVTRTMSSKLNFKTQITATDFNEDMIRYAQSAHPNGKILWRQADATDLPFKDETFDAVVCQFGVMFFPDKIKGFSEVYRVLKDGDVFIFNVWDKLIDNEFTYVVNNSMKDVFPTDPSTFYQRIPFGYYDKEVIIRDLKKSGFKKAPEIITIEKRSAADSPMDVAISLCEGTPLRNEILARDSSKLEYSKEVAAKAIERHFGISKLDGLMKAHVIIAKKEK